MKLIRRLGIAALVGAPTIVGLVVLVYLPLAGGDRIVSGRGSVVVVGPIQLYYGSSPSPSGREVRDFDVWFDLGSYDQDSAVDTLIQFANVTIHNISQGPVNVESKDTFFPGYIGLLPSFGGPLITELNLQPDEMCFAQLGVFFEIEQWKALKPGNYPFEVTIVAQPTKEVAAVQTGDGSTTMMPCSVSGGDQGKEADR